MLVIGFGDRRILLRHQSHALPLVILPHLANLLRDVDALILLFKLALLKLSLELLHLLVALLLETFLKQLEDVRYLPFDDIHALLQVDLLVDVEQLLNLLIDLVPLLIELVLAEVLGFHFKAHEDLFEFKVDDALELLDGAVFVSL